MIRSAGILLWRLDPVEVLIAHMGGPFWAGKDAGAWSLPKGVYDPDVETAMDAARREFGEELGLTPPDVTYIELGEFAVTSGKRLTVFAGDGSALSLDHVVFGEFEMEWPPRSGRVQSFPEVDRVEWTTMDAAAERLAKGQRPVLEALAAHLDARPRG